MCREWKEKKKKIESALWINTGKANFGKNSATDAFFLLTRI